MLSIPDFERVAQVESLQRLAFLGPQQLPDFNNVDNPITSD